MDVNISTATVSALMLFGIPVLTKLLPIGAVTTLLAVWTSFQKYKDIVSWITLRIEKDSADGKFTSEEKEQAAIDCYKEKVKPGLNVYWRFILSISPTEKIIRSLIRILCKKTKELKKS